MTREELLEIAKSAGLGAILTHNSGESRIFIEGADWSEEVERFAAMLLAKQDDDWKAATYAEIEAAIEATKKKAANLAYAVCAETRHVTLGDKIAAAIRSMK